MEASPDSPKNDGDHKIAVGISLGTTFSRVAVSRNGQVEVIATERHYQDIPSKADDRNVRGGDPVAVYSEEVATKIFERLKEKAEEYLGEEVKDTAVTVPVHLGDAQRQAVKNSASLAGLNVLRVVNETSMAAVAYALHTYSEQHDGEEFLILVYGFGGRSSNATLICAEAGIFETLHTARKADLGGEDLTGRLLDHFVALHKERTGIDITGTDEVLRKVWHEAERSKCVLSQESSTQFELGSFDGSGRISEILTRNKFEDLTEDMFNKTLESVEEVLQGANKTKEDIKFIILTGGSSLIPRVQYLVKEYFAGKELLNDLPPMEVIVRGAAIQADILSTKDTTTTILGWPDMVPYALGIEAPAGKFSRILIRNRFIPCQLSKTFPANVDDPTVFHVKIIGGEMEFPKDNRQLGEFTLTSITPGPVGEPQVEVLFQIDMDNTLEVSATDKVSGRSESLRVDWSPYDRPSEAEIEYMDHQEKIREKQSQSEGAS